MEKLCTFCLSILWWFSVFCFAATETDKLRHLEKILLLHLMEEYPEYATELGNSNYNSIIESYTIEAFERRKIAMEEMLGSIYKINTTSLTRSEFLDLRILHEHVVTYLDGYRWRQYGNLNILNNLEGVIKKPHWLHLEEGINSFKYHGRLQRIPKQIDEVIILMKLAVELNRTNHISSMDICIGRLERDLHLLLAVTHGLSRTSIPEKRRQMSGLIPRITEAFRKLINFLKREYLPACRKTERISSLHDGQAYYQAILKYYLGTDESPEKIHRKGLKEIRRIQHNMVRIMRQVGFNGTLRRFYKHIKKIPEFSQYSKIDMIGRYDDIIHREIEPNMGKLFKDVSIETVRLIPVDDPQFTSLGAYQEGKVFINVYGAENRSTITMLPLALHESKPGHHFQDMYADHLDIPLYRKHLLHGHSYAVPSTFPTYTAYVEGWALYAESLGEEMGLFENPYLLFGRYLSEMLRACRLVTDTGIHALGWTRDKAIRYLSKYTYLSYQEATSEVDRYIIWPGHACTYKIGEMKIKALRKKAEKILGDVFNIKEFHDQILRVGPVSLGVLEYVINDWIELTKPATNHVSLNFMTHMNCLLIFMLCMVFQIT